MSDAADDEAGRSNALHLLGVGAQIAGDLLEAREWMTQRLALVRATGNEFLIGSEACNLSMVERQLGDLDAAEALAREALEIERRTGTQFTTPFAISGLASIATERRQFDRAATLVGAAEAIMEAQEMAWPPDERPHYEHLLATLPEAMGEAAFEEARTQGPGDDSQRGRRPRPRALDRRDDGLRLSSDGHDRGAAARDAEGQQVPDDPERERRQPVPPGPRQVGDRLEFDPTEPGSNQCGADGGRVVAPSDQRMGIGRARLHHRLQPPLWTPRHVEVGRNERVAAIDGRHDQRAARAEPAVHVRQRRWRIGEMLEGEVRQHHVERVIRERSPGRHRSTITNSSR